MPGNKIKHKTPKNKMKKPGYNSRRKPKAKGLEKNIRKIKKEVSTIKRFERKAHMGNNGSMNYNVWLEKIHYAEWLMHLAKCIPGIRAPFVVNDQIVKAASLVNQITFPITSSWSMDLTTPAIASCASNGYTVLIFCPSLAIMSPATNTEYCSGVGIVHVDSTTSLDLSKILSPADTATASAQGLSYNKVFGGLAGEIGEMPIPWSSSFIIDILGTDLYRSGIAYMGAANLHTLHGSIGHAGTTLNLNNMIAMSKRRVINPRSLEVRIPLINDQLVASAKATYSLTTEDYGQEIFAWVILQTPFNSTAQSTFSMEIVHTWNSLLFKTPDNVTVNGLIDSSTIREDDIRIKDTSGINVPYESGAMLGTSEDYPGGGITIEGIANGGWEMLKEVGAQAKGFDWKKGLKDAVKTTNDLREIASGLQQMGVLRSSGRPRNDIPIGPRSRDPPSKPIEPGLPRELITPPSNISQNRPSDPSDSNRSSHRPANQRLIVEDDFPRGTANQIDRRADAFDYERRSVSDASGRPDSAAWVMPDGDL